jgi:hypothetical protein
MNVNDLSPEQLRQEITIAVPLSAVINTNKGGWVNVAGRLAQPQRARPKIGDQGEHGIYAGIARGDDTMDDHIVEVLAETPNKMTWDAAKAWVESIGGTLPTRKEQALLFANVPELFEKEWYWSCEQYAGNDAYAWCQGFGNGGQYGTRENYELRARAVRRLPIE